MINIFLWKKSIEDVILMRNGLFFVCKIKFNYWIKLHEDC